MSNDWILGFELLLPVVEDSDLLLGEAIEAGGDVFFILAHLGQGSAGVLAGEQGVGAAGAVEGLARCDVKHAALDGHVDRLRRVRAVVEAQLFRRELHSCRERR